MRKVVRGGTREVMMNRQRDIQQVRRLSALFLYNQLYFSCKELEWI